MKKFTVLLSFAVLIVVFTASSSFCQTTKNKPFFTIDVSGGVDLPLLDLKGTGPLGIYQFTEYGVSVGPCIAVNVKMAVYTQKMLQLRLYTLFGYSHFTNDGAGGINIGIVKPPWPTGSIPPAGYLNGGTSSVRMNLPYGGIGFEYAQYTDRAARSSFNFDFDVALTLVNGRAYQTDINGVETFNTFHSSPRLGFGFNVFWNYRLSPVVGINLGSRFQWSNLIGKSSNNTDEDAWMFLNDDTNGRNIAFLNFFGGMSFYFGKK
jgi:hypothetical protein